MEDQENEEQQEQSIGKQIAEQGKQMAEQAVKDTLKQVAKKVVNAAGKTVGGLAKKFITKILIAVAPYIIVAIVAIMSALMIYVIVDRIREIGSTILSSISTFIIAGDNGPIAPNPKEMIDLINKELEEAGIDKKELYLGNSLQADLYLYKYMASSLATQLPYIKDGPTETMKDIATKVLIPGATSVDFIKDIFGEEVQGIVKIKRQTGNNKIDLTYKKYEDLVKLIEENNESALKYFSIDEEWMLCIAKSNKKTTKNPDDTIQTENTLEETKIPYQTLISGYSVPFEFFITLQQLSQNAEYVSAVADLIQGGEIELTIFDTTKVITEENTYKYKIRKKWVEKKEVPKVSYISTVSSRSFDREVTATKLATETKKGGKNPTSSSTPTKNPTNTSGTSGGTTTPSKGENKNPDKNEGTTTPSKGENKDPDKNEGTTTPGKGENKNPDKNEGTTTPGKGENKNPDKNEGTTTPDKGENKDPDKNETPDKNPDEDDEPKTEIVPVQMDETSEEIVETTIITQEINSITVAVTKADVWVIKQEDAAYKKCETIEYPLGENGITNELDPEATDEEIGETSEGEWKVDISESSKETVIQEEMQLETSELNIDESIFLGLWKSIWLGDYIQGASYAPDGFLVKYKIPNRIYKYESPVGNILSSEYLLYDQLEKSENTQMHAQLMRYLINYYKDPTTAVKPDLSIFTTSEFRETNSIRFGVGYWWPLEDTSQTRITSGFGYRGDIGKEGASKNHKGIDIGVPVGSKVIASADGTVEVAGYSAKSGNWIKINHSNGIKTVYMHNSSLLVTVGQTVKQGDVIALSGNTGVSTGPHLHFGVELNGEYVNPLDYVSTENPRPTSVAPDVPVNVEAWAPYITQAFEELGYQCTDEKVNAILRQIRTESQGDQFIIQGIKDSNSGKPIKIGDGICPWCESPSGGSCRNTNIGHGLLQFIPTTFYANMILGHTDIFNGYDQIITCIIMLEKRSGSYTDYIGKGTGWG